MMKKVLLLLFALAFLPVGSVSANPIEVSSNVDIYSETYQDDYDVWVDSAYTNRFLNEFSKEFDVQLDESIMSLKKDFSGAITINLEDEENIELEELYVSYSKEESNNPSLTITIDFAQEWNSVSEETFIRLFKILAPHLSEEEIKQGHILTKDFNEERTMKNIEFTPLFVFNRFDENEALDLLHKEKPENANKIILENGNDKDDELLDEVVGDSFNPEDYTIITYEEIMRDRSGKMGTKHTFYAEVLQYFEDGDVAMAMLMRNGSPDMIYQAYFTTLPDQRLVEGDQVDVYGTLMGLEGYETVRGSENTTPVIFIDEILIQGIDY